MLDYMKEGAGIDPGAQTDNVLSPGSDPADGFVVTAAQEKKVQQGTIILVIMFALGGGALWFMVQKSVPKAAVAAASVSETDQIEIAIAKVTGTKSEFFKGVDSVMSRFNEFSKARQVNVNELQKNPFEHEKFARLSSVSQIQQTSSDSSSQSESLSENVELESQAHSMQLQSIMKSPRGNCCMIDYKVLYVGQTINGWKITGISDDSVELSMKETKFSLKIASEVR